MLLDDPRDCTHIMGETCTEPQKIGEPPVCTPVHVSDCPKGSSGFDLWGSALSWAPWVVTGILLLSVIALLVLFLIQMRRTRDAEAAAGKARADAVAWQAAANQAAAGGFSQSTVNELLELGDLTDSEAAKEKLSQVLAPSGVARMAVAAGDPFNDAWHRSVERRQATDHSQDRTIAAVLRDGYVSGSQVVRVADVAVWMAG
ncbi:nucleotide exchange factor GrpE [Leifsonia sp. Leaf264]|uniref:nucleotide exchange factor GrpE n=1 Tax=Leifsonia sp. Leaf264 TaxID=1736314 RepID=UPI0006F8542C|nr:nucleotide exchange factor GrpE [Leifsonia sp. Leaf264]KQO98487.1 hypothetical protein ASF30_10520 [Leifsonia sp. Leaf264]